MGLQDQWPLTAVKTGEGRGSFKARELFLLFLKCVLVFLFLKHVFGEIIRGTSHSLGALCDGIFLPGNSWIWQEHLMRCPRLVSSEIVAQMCEGRFNKCQCFPLGSK